MPLRLVVGKLIVESWEVGKLESWKVGKLESWEVGKLVVGKLVVGLYSVISCLMINIQTYKRINEKRYKRKTVQTCKRTNAKTYKRINVQTTNSQT
jgi:hypothetical protein